MRITIDTNFSPKTWKMTLNTSEQILDRKFEKTCGDFIMKTSIGLVVGVSVSFLVLKKRVWPVALTTGFGMGMAYQESLNRFSL